MYRLRIPALLLLVLSTMNSSTAADANSIKLATWNLEWLLTPQTFSALKGTCSSDDSERRAARRRLPCNVARTLERSSSDYAALRHYAGLLDADVIALEEVDGPDAARQLFSQYRFCFTGSNALQNNGFAIRRGIPFHCEADLQELSLGDSVRRGAVVVLYPGSSHEVHLLGVHLKSGCPRQPLDGALQACRLLARQLPVLKAWIESQVRAGHRFGLMGDFNRDLLGEQRTMAAGSHLTMIGALSHSESPGYFLASAAGREDFRNCVRGQRHNGFIDYILLSEALFNRRVPNSVDRLVWSPEDGARRILSDHCPVAVRIVP